MSETDLALVCVIKERCQPGMELAGVLVAGLAADGHPGVQIAVDWPAFLGCTEDEIVDTLTGYCRREAERLERQARGDSYSPRVARLRAAEGQPPAAPVSALSLDVARMMRDWLASEDCQVRLRELAAERWAKIKAA
jgi:hypothetical protein